MNCTDLLLVQNAFWALSNVSVEGGVDHIERLLLFISLIPSIPSTVNCDYIICSAPSVASNILPNHSQTCFKFALFYFLNCVESAPSFLVGMGALNIVKSAIDLHPGNITLTEAVCEFLFQMSRDGKWVVEC